MDRTKITGTDFFETLGPDLGQTEPLPRPATAFMHPYEVAQDLLLTEAEKRQVLASWASDVHAVPGAPALRQLDNGAVVHIDDVLVALRSLDGPGTTVPATHDALRHFARRARSRISVPLKSALRRSWFDDDDDPPPCPAVIARPPFGPLSGGVAVEPGLALVA